MRLAKPFYRLPVRFDAARLAAEANALPREAWAPHPNGIPGNSSVRLISANGGQNDDVDGPMLPTPHLERSPYIRQVLASFGVVWSRSRLMRLAPGASVPEHADINHHWFNRVRVHIPVLTRPQVRFRCGEDCVHMAAGDAWVFDNWRLHSVENPTDSERIHLVADTSGTSSFWRFVAEGERSDTRSRELRFDPQSRATLLTEQVDAPPVLPPAEVELQALDLTSELASGSAPAERLERYRALLDDFARDWRQVYAVYGSSVEGAAEYARLRDALRAGSREIGEGLLMRTNRIAAHTVLEARLLRHLLRDRTRLEAPIFIVAAPRSGSTLLFETLAASRSLCTLGGEAHLLVESLPQLRPDAPGVDSNRLTAEHANAGVAERMLATIARDARDSQGRAVRGASFRLLEKTPKNVLRIPFFDRLFPDAHFIFLWRDPRENLSSIIEAWRSGRWKTYAGLDGFEDPWSLLLPPGWRAMRGKPLEEIAAFQWDSANRIGLDDLERLPRERWTHVSYAELLADPVATVRRLAAFAGIAFDEALATRASQPLPHSSQTHTPPAPGKWRRNEEAILRVLPALEPTWRRLQALTP